MNIPRKVIAKRDDVVHSGNIGFVKGDTIEITSKGDYVDYIGVNLTRPELNSKHGHVYLHKGEYKELSKSYYDKHKKDCKTVYFLGLPLFKIK
ncbi:hypothetical protein [Oceanobacillus sp. FSL H7-0719]|uniref:hypothetical protein n=1 Tax=Oceanobacillus sp. FSL H7-0719 TaxID=2954507 RepID=UPI003246E553